MFFSKTLDFKKSLKNPIKHWIYQFLDMLSGFFSEIPSHFPWFHTGIGHHVPVSVKERTKIVLAKILKLIKEFRWTSENIHYLELHEDFKIISRRIVPWAVSVRMAFHGD